MSHDLICAWLKLPAKTWPPDHYTLLGLKPGETDGARIERHVQLRMEWVRCYQLAHPDLVTEAMNRLAQAFDCLRDRDAKNVYDIQLLGKGGRKQTQTAAETFKLVPPKAMEPPRTAASALPIPLLPAVATETLPQRPDKATMSMPVPGKVPAPPAPPAPTVPAPSGPPPPASVAAPTDSAVAAPAVNALDVAIDEPLDPALEAARSGPARRGLGTKRALYQRISRTRQLIRAWVQAGKYLGDARYRLGQKTEAIDLVRQLTIIRQQLKDYPPLLGQAGQPGYLVIALARQPEIVKTYQALDPALRKSYVRDWQVGLAFLAAYRQFLREELWKLRRQGRVGRLLRLTRSLITDAPGLWLFLLAMLAANIAFPTLREFLPWELAAGALLVLLFVVFQNAQRERSLHRTRRRRAE
ncbi:hypothetical protein AYO44_02630 [Planctomycetaceae bacterium SCGC AG-212-F19]|nr:hypothetical protein AYO44_02630 [Planctomycetaceae bacterium SCGC AG-212-F19]